MPRKPVLSAGLMGPRGPNVDFTYLPTIFMMGRSCFFLCFLGGWKQFPVLSIRPTVWWVIVTSLFQLKPKSWYQQTAQSSVNKLLLIVWHYRLLKQQYDLLKTPLLLALSAYNSKTSSVTPIFYNRVVISMIRCNFLQSLKKLFEGGSEPS